MRCIRCPEDISIVGMNNMQFMDAIAPVLTTIHAPTAVGRRGGDAPDCAD
ncbi:substrate-binding domain-containing protein [Bradyrhizobium sp. U87765 SZCCT0131]|nr:substrate-binding domain-containing protein [Bradyrhizobium sp. U87765 SZCCT0131]MBR1264577.1 substrate-binding domain-containing protein [Bradyrhizobium sp. U87765 SZCCT0134]MBR1304517.1 substrate-binding domain-containing protein [Bradyrhizobium sp. U87765 SZCCT0110]MBR1322626.1 substrate-binding domain-containing protein [Bradyrhizobium sp. U87765 SZCCT0109]MBR1346446.1 substrate-binding domain-containing protein [Bradyrhizobium sp. U87765 SZCCT0048]